MIYISNTILIVDDDKSICEFVSEGLYRDGYASDIALTADEAISKFQQKRFDIVLLDIKLPDESGIELLKKFQAHSKDTKAIMITGVTDLDTAIHAMKLGASDYLVKPFTIDKLGAVIRSVLESSKKSNLVHDSIYSINDAYVRTQFSTRSFRRINSIAYGVDAQVDYFDFHSKIVTKKTIDVARWLRLPPEEIERWSVARNELYSKRRNYVESLVRKLKRNPIAQMILGLTHTIEKYPNLNGKQNIGDIGHGAYDS
jgi:DNA-binding response OmpR family regulator